MTKCHHVRSYDIEDDSSLLYLKKFFDFFFLFRKLYNTLLNRNRYLAVSQVLMYLCPLMTYQR